MTGKQRDALERARAGLARKNAIADLRRVLELLTRAPSSVAPLLHQLGWSPNVARGRRVYCRLRRLADLGHVRRAGDTYRVVTTDLYFVFRDWLATRGHTIQPSERCR